MSNAFYAPMIVIPGEAAVGKGFTTQLVSQIAIQHSFDPVIVGTGVVFREVAYMLNALELVSCPQNALEVIREGIWSYLRGAGFTLELRGHKIEEGNPLLMQDVVSGIISRFSIDQTVRDALFDFNNGAIGGVVSGILSRPLENGDNPSLIIYDTRFAPGEFPIELLERLASLNMLAVLHLQAENEQAMWELARYRAASIAKIPITDVCEAQVQSTLDKLNQRNAADVLFNPSFVLDHPTLAETYYRILNNPLKGVDALTSQLLPPIGRLARSLQLAS